jgi:hypothetical protein
MIGIQIKKTGCLAFLQQEEHAYQKKEKKAQEEITISGENGS